jgi:hypothetical protein
VRSPRSIAFCVNRKPGTKANAREVEDLVDHPDHPLGAGENSSGGFGDWLGIRSPEQKACARGNGAQRVSQIVTEDADEHLVEARCSLEILDKADALLFRPLSIAHVLKGNNHTGCAVAASYSRRGIGCLQPRSILCAKGRVHHC